MSTDRETQPPRERSIIAIVAITVLVALAVIATVLFIGARQEARDVDKAQELLDSFADAGISVSFTAEQVAQVLGDDGGATCADPNSALARSTLLAGLSNGAAGPGLRPTLVESRLLQGQLLIIQTYCPEEAEDFQQFVDSLNTVDTGNDTDDSDDGDGS
ncbi:hypothetical protein R8Z57_10755 [Microbacterium sp. M3]|uniref:DUF732 domain-containing protein n=1 Tax=Microbacterium arthrosphaerae TaxID=792652 RepID=A0ABU4H1P1_9MICO|nr:MULTISPECIES: hypothetical protein [Microbacterium]MDW4573249.1 hypothetical protein [Microbacterium arthrosphaerae]MDW7607104.1 hypothetical protein [Microbacterium sp. M3]